MQANDNCNNSTMQADIITMEVVNPLERYVLTPCETVYPSLAGEATLTGSLISSNGDELVDCGVAAGIFAANAAVTTTVSGGGTRPIGGIMETRNTLAAFRQHFQQSLRTGLAISLWFQPSADSFQVQQPILTAGSIIMKDGLQDQESGCSGYNVLLGQYQGHLLVKYTDNDPAKSCRVLLVRSVNLVPNQLTHVVVVWSTSQTNIYMDGQPVVTGAPNAFDTTLTNWDPSGSWQLLGNYQSDAVFTGSILQFSLLDQALTPIQVAAVYNQGLILVEPQEPPVLEAEALVNVTIPQGWLSPVTLRLGGPRVSTAKLPLMVQVLSLPRQGVLTLQGQDDTPIVVNSRLPLAFNASGLVVEYTLGSADYFNAPSINGYGVDLQLDAETFDYRLITLDVTMENIVAASPSVTQSVQVVHVNHPPTIRAPDEAVQSLQIPTEFVVVDGIQLLDALDFNLDRVRVDAWSNVGQLTLNSANRLRADFSSCADRTFSAWQCVGDGVLDRNVTFAAIPDDVASIFTNLRYDSLVPGMEDEITIRVSDGEGGSCLSRQEHEEYSVGLGNTVATIRSECFQVQAVIRVPAVVIVKQDGASESGLFGIPNSDFKNFGVADFLYWVLFATVLISVCTCARRCFRCLARGKAVIPDDINYEQDLDISVSDYSSESNIPDDINYEQGLDVSVSDCSSESDNSLRGLEEP
jgi:hypothetical protein